MKYIAEYTTFPANAQSIADQVMKTETLTVNTEKGYLAAEAKALKEINKLQRTDKNTIYTFIRVRS